MKHIKVESSQLASVGYDQINEILEVQFVKGTKYLYYDVPMKEVINMLFNASIGSYFMKNISKNYKYEKVEE